MDTVTRDLLNTTVMCINHNSPSKRCNISMSNSTGTILSSVHTAENSPAMRTSKVKLLATKINTTNTVLKWRKPDAHPSPRYGKTNTGHQKSRYQLQSPTLTRVREYFWHPGGFGLCSPPGSSVPRIFQARILVPQ